MIFRIGPVLPFAATEDRIRFDKDLAEIERECPGLTIGHPAMLEFDSREFADAWFHLNPEGARHFTRIVYDFRRRDADRGPIRHGLG